MTNKTNYLLLAYTMLLTATHIQAMENMALAAPSKASSPYQTPALHMNNFTDEIARLEKEIEQKHNNSCWPQIHNAAKIILNVTATWHCSVLTLTGSSYYEQEATDCECNKQIYALSIAAEVLLPLMVSTYAEIKESGIAAPEKEELKKLKKVKSD